MKAQIISSRSLSSKLSLAIALVAIIWTGTLRSQSSRQVAFDAIRAAKVGTMIVCVDTQTKSIEALNTFIDAETSVKRKAELIEERQRKIQFREIFQQSANEAFEANYDYGKYVVIPDTRLKAYRDSLHMLDEPYLILVKRNDVRELGVVNADNVHVPGPFPQYFDGVMTNLNKIFAEGTETQEVYTQYLKKSIYKLNARLNILSYRLEGKQRRKELKKAQKSEQPK